MIEIISYKNGNPLLRISAVNTGIGVTGLEPAAS